MFRTQNHICSAYNYICFHTIIFGSHIIIFVSQIVCACVSVCARAVCRVSVCVHARVCVCDTIHSHFSLTVGVHTHLRLLYGKMPRVHPPRGATVAAMVVGGVVWMFRLGCERRHHQSDTTATTTARACQHLPYSHS